MKKALEVNPRVPLLREVIRRLAPLLASKGLRVVMRGLEARCEYDSRTGQPTAIYLPELPDQCSDELLDAVQGYLDHECAHALFSSGKELKRARAEGVPYIANALEDTFIEREMSKLYPGSLLNLQRTNQFWLDKIMHPAFLEAEKAGAGYFGALFVIACRAWAGQETCQRYMEDKWHHIKPFTDLIDPALIARIPTLSSSTEVVDLAIAIKACLKNPIKMKVTADPDAGEDNAPSDNIDNIANIEIENPPPPPKSDAPAAPSEGEGESGGNSEVPASGDDQQNSEPESDSDTEDDYRVSSDESSNEAGDGTPDERQAEDGEDAEPESTTDGDGDGGGEGKGDEQAGDGEPSDEDAEAGDAPGAGEGSGQSESGDQPGESTDGDTTAEESNTGEDGPAEEGKPSAPTADQDEINEAIAAMLREDSFDSAIADALTSSAIFAAKESDYIIFSREKDVIAPCRREFDQKAVTTMTEKVDGMAYAMQAQLERLVAARSLSYWAGGKRSGRLNTSALHRLTLGRDDVFRRKVVNQSRDTAVSLLADLSGSMCGSKVRTAMYSAYAFSMLLERLRVKNEVLGFSTKGWDDERWARTVIEAGRKAGVRFSRYEYLDIPIFKAFDEPLGPEQTNAMAHAAEGRIGMENNIDGESVDVALQRLATRPEERKVLIVLSDGQPAFNGDCGAGRAHLRGVVQKAIDSDIEILGIGIEDRAVKDYYPKHIVIDSVSDLPTKLMEKLHEILL